MVLSGSRRIKHSAIHPELQVEVLVFESEYSSVNNSTTAYFEDGSGTTFFDNGTERHFTHNISESDYLYENGTIYYSSNLTEAFAD